MKIKPLEIPDLKIIEPKVFGDDRGYFFECWNRAEFESAGINCDFVQDNQSKSSFGVLRGLHYQAAPHTQAKLVRVISGCVLDVAVDIRRGSATFGKYAAVELSGENKRMLYIPRGFAHGFAVLSGEALFTYKCDNFYCPAAERGIAFDDPELGIDWRIKRDSWITSPKDKLHPHLSEAELL